MKKNSPVFFRTIWLSDIHLGSKDCHANYLLDFLENVSCHTLYLVGDIVDMLALKKKLFWPQSHYSVLKKIQSMAANGTRVVYIPGNHDASLREFCGGEFLQVELVESAIHLTAGGKRLWILHGDVFDHAILYRALNRVIGHHAHNLAVFLNRWTHFLRKMMGLPYWSFANYLKLHVAKARDAIESFENAAIEAAMIKSVDGIVCGHIHKPELRMINNILYCNDGDWTESCTALVETLSGDLMLLHWTEQMDTLKQYSYQEKRYACAANS